MVICEYQSPIGFYLFKFKFNIYINKKIIHMDNKNL